MYKTSLLSGQTILHRLFSVDEILRMGEIWIRLETHIIIQPVKGTGLEHRHERLAVLQSPLEVEGVPIPCSSDEAFHFCLRLHFCQNEFN